MDKYMIQLHTVCRGMLDIQDPIGESKGFKKIQHKVRSMEDSRW